jgi:segregation and condensation protein A
MTKQEEIFQLLFDKDELTWQSIIYEAVRLEQMDPWDIDITLLTKKYLEMLRKLKKMNFRISGKILLAAAILLKIKSNRLLGKDLDQFDSLFAQTEEPDDLYVDENFPDLDLVNKEKKPRLIPRTPQPRKRKVSIYDLVDALQRALEVKERRVMRAIPKEKVKIPEKGVDIGIMIKEVYSKIKKFFSFGNKKLTFNKLIPSDSKEDKIYTFIPLLHLTNQRKIDLNQEEHFGEIEILLRQSVNEVERELGIR